MVDFKKLNDYRDEALRQGDNTLAEEIENMAAYAQQNPEAFLKEYPMYRKA